jgi:hypothetical protein
MLHNVSCGKNFVGNFFRGIFFGTVTNTGQTIELKFFFLKILRKNYETVSPSLFCVCTTFEKSNHDTTFQKIGI